MKKIFLSFVFSAIAVLSTSAAFSATIPALGWPVDKTASNPIVKGFGYANPFHGVGRVHYTLLMVGVDIKANAGDRVLASEPGTVSFVMPDFGTTSGYVVLSHVDKMGSSYTTLYGNLTSIDVKPGDSVVKGQQLADVYDFGANSAVHFGVRNAPYSFGASTLSYLYSYYAPSSNSVKVNYPELWIVPTFE